MCTMGPPLHTDKCRRAARISRLRFFFFIIIIYRFYYDVRYRPCESGRELILKTRSTDDDEADIVR